MGGLKRFYRLHEEAGTDEAGRGCLAGPVTAAALILPKNFTNEVLTDSKQLSETKRESLRPVLEKYALSFGVCHVFPDEIDEVNILNASILAMHRALDQLTCKVNFIIVDGNRFKPYGKIPHECIVKGDGKYLSIAGASVLAKTHRDEYMTRLHKEFPMYNWKQNKGYPTKEHREAIRKFGLTKYHRKSFKQLPEQLKLEF
ncbi:ribonuclease HII [Allomuricauda sp. SCSIO 65647]|uniref:ribonuclease HII n=1 Tax=Allomuricauda sp. SCSIO 65647 TaxID=2908843 RepID=UPI001F25CBB1|nr:ribonuclease HII [Muricauda sp. SCSIO 65647]UJH66477.1 ribonuclease HII [Muricauda sp. SCSIO 65647]